MRRLRHLSSQRRTVATNRILGMYTSHMTGFASMVSDNLILGNFTLVLGAVGALLAFTTGAAATAVLVNWARQTGLHSEYALPLLIEAALLLVFGLIGATFNRQTPFAVPFTVLMLAFIMGLQNALVTKISSSAIRTTHMTGVITDLGIELGKLFYWNRLVTSGDGQVRADRSKLRLYVGLLSAFMGGGLVGAAGFKHVGFVWVVPLATLLLVLSLPPLVSDLRRLSKP